MALNLSNEEIGKNIAHGITGVRKILQENLELEIDARKRVGSISDPIRRKWTEMTLVIRDAMASDITAGVESPDEDDMMNAFFADQGNGRMLDAQTACEVIMHDEGRLAEMILERFYSTDSIWLLNRVRNVIDRFLDSQPTTDRTNSLSIVPPASECETEFGFGEAGVTLKDPILNQIIGWGHLSCGAEVPILFGPEDPPESPIILHKILKSGALTSLTRICDFGISRNCWNRMDKLLAFPLGNSIVYFPTCTECAVDLLDFIDEPERDSDGNLLEFFSVEA